MREQRVLTSNESACVCAVANWVSERAASALERFFRREDARLTLPDKKERDDVCDLLHTFQIRVLRIQMS